MANCSGAKNIIVCFTFPIIKFTVTSSSHCGTSATSLPLMVRTKMNEKCKLKVPKLIPCKEVIKVKSTGVKLSTTQLHKKKALKYQQSSTNLSSCSD